MQALETKPQIKLRSYQLTTVRKVKAQFEELLTFLREHTPTEIESSDVLQARLKALRTAIVVLATGLGKTIVFCSAEKEIRSFLETAHQQHLSTIILAHRDELLQQAREKYYKIDPAAMIGLVGGGRREYGTPITIASVQTVSREKHLQQLRENFAPQLIIVDEAHHVAADGYQRVLDAFPQAFVLLVTATPYRLDGKKICEVEPLINMGLVEAVKGNYLCPPVRVNIRTDTSLDGISKKQGDYSIAELDERIDTFERNNRVFTGYMEYAAGRKFIGFSVTIKHAYNLACGFSLNGIAVGVIHGGTPAKEREKTLEMFKHGELMGIFNCGILTEGFDDPGVSCIIMARPTQSTTLYVQCVGRGARILPEDEGKPYSEWGKKNFMVLDITDNASKHKLEALNLEMAIGVEVNEDENLLEAIEREEEEEREAQAREQEAREARERKLRVIRHRDEVIPLLVGQYLQWDVNEYGYATAVFGKAGHRIALIPHKRNNELFAIAGSLFPSFEKKWLDTDLRDKEASMDRAEELAREILEEEMKKAVQPRTQHWTLDPASPDQIRYLEQHHIPFPVDDNGACQWTKGRASQAIGAYIASHPYERRKKAKATA